MGVNFLLRLKSEDNSHTFSITWAAPDIVLALCLPSDWSRCRDLNFMLELWSKAETTAMSQEHIKHYQQVLTFAVDSVVK